MSNTQIDYLLQLAVPRPDASLSAGRPRDDTPGFDSHFRQASASSTPPSLPSSPPHPLAAGSNDAQPTDSAASPEEAKTNDATATATDDETASEEHESESVAETAAGVAQAEQAAAPAVVDEAAADANPQHGRSIDVAGLIGTNAADAGSLDLAPGDAAEPDQTAPESHVQVAAAKSARLTTTEKNVAVPATGKLVDGNQPTETAATSVSQPDAAPRTKAKSGKGGSVHNEPVGAGEGGEDQRRTRAAAAAQSAGTAAAPANADAKTAVAATDKDETKLSTQAEAPSDEKPGRARPRAAGNVRPAAAQVAPLVAANAQLAQLGDAAPSAATESNAKPKEVALGSKEGLLSPFARLDRAGTRGNFRAGENGEGPKVDPARFVSRVARAIHTAQERGGPLQLRLSPPELGSLRLELSVNQGALTATIETDNSNARQVLLDNLPALRDRLAEQNVRIERFDVDVRRDGGGGQPNPGPYERGNQQHHEHAPHRPATPRGASDPSIVEPASPVHRSITNTSINVIA